MPTPDDRAFWLRKIDKLAVDKASGDPAPHKPLLLLVVCELAELGVVGNEILPLNGEFAFRFAGYWTVVASRRSQRPDVRMPFYHLKREGFWQPLDADNRLAVDKKLATLARFDAGFRACLEEPEFRRQARLLLITTYFRPQEQVALGSLLDLNIPPQSAVRETFARLHHRRGCSAGPRGPISPHRCPRIQLHLRAHPLPSRHH